jgi:TetR/AcrR family transcriptional regulator
MSQDSFTRTQAQIAGPTAQALLNAGRELFAEYGFDGVTVETLARRAGANKAMISYHFGGKEGLYSAILETTFAPVHAKLQEIRKLEGGADRQLHEYFSVFRNMAVDHPGFPRMVLREVLAGGKHLKPQHLPHFLGVLGTLRFIIEKGIAEGRFRPVDPVTTFLIVNGGLIFYLSTGAFRDRVLSGLGDPPPFPDPGDFVPAFEDFVRRGLRPDTETSPNERSA